MGIVRIFIARGHGNEPLLASVFCSKVETTRRTCLGEDGGQRASETELVIDIFEQDETGIRR